MSDLPNIVPAAFEVPELSRLIAPVLQHKPRILMLYGSLRERSYTLFGPAQVARRLINMAFGKDLPAPTLAVISSVLMPAALIVLVLTAPAIAGAIAFAIIFGLGSGLFSIFSGTLPLALFGKSGFGKRLGWISLGRLGVSAVAPFALSVALGAIGPKPSVWILAGAGLACVAVFGEIWRRAKVTVAPAGLSQPA